ncbi:MAG: NmrA family NAD(P)-binding protein [Bacteroidales bacterium]
MYVITGATGNTGKPITLSLLNAGKKVRIISRNAAKAKEFTDKGAELFIGDQGNPDVLKKAFEGATAVYAMIAIDFASKDMTTEQVKQAIAIAEALKSTGVKYVVSLSSQGAHLEKDSGVVLGLNRMEKLFDQVNGLNTLHLRAGYFMENTLGMIGLVKQAGILGSPVKQNTKIPAIATRDIADYAAKRLLALDFKGLNTQDLLGSRDVTYGEIAKVYGKAIGKPDLNYVEFSFEDFKKALMGQMGASENIADNFNTFIKALNEGRITSSAVRNSESTTPTSIEDFAATFAYVYNL